MGSLWDFLKSHDFLKSQNSDDSQNGWVGHPNSHRNSLAPEWYPRGVPFWGTIDTLQEPMNSYAKW